FAAWTFLEAPNQTTFNPPQEFVYGKQYFWRVRGTDSNTVGPFSGTQAFQTLAPPPPPPAPPSGGGGGGACSSGTQSTDNTCVVAQAKADLQNSGVNLGGDCGAFRIVALAAKRITG